MTAQARPMPLRTADPGEPRARNRSRLGGFDLAGLRAGPGHRALQARLLPDRADDAMASSRQDLPRQRLLPRLQLQ